MITCFHVTASCHGRLATGESGGNARETLSSPPPPLRPASTSAHDFLSCRLCLITAQMAARTGFNKNNSGSSPVKHRGVQRRLIPDTAVKRIMQEARELANDPCTDYAAAPLEVSLYWGCASYATLILCTSAGRYLCEYKSTLVAPQV